VLRAAQNAFDVLRRGQEAAASAALAAQRPVAGPSLNLVAHTAGAPAPPPSNARLPDHLARQLDMRLTNSFRGHAADQPWWTVFQNFVPVAVLQVRSGPPLGSWGLVTTTCLERSVTCSCEAEMDPPGKQQPLAAHWCFLRCHQTAQIK
jgi:hypothetical protein